MGKDKFHRAHPYRPIGSHSTTNNSAHGLPPARSGISIMSPSRGVPHQIPAHRQPNPPRLPPSKGSPFAIYPGSNSNSYLPGVVRPAHMNSRPPKPPRSPPPFHVQDRPSVIQHTKNGIGSSKKLILNPAPVRHTGLPKEVWGPPNIIKEKGAKRPYIDGRNGVSPAPAHSKTNSESSTIKQFILGHHHKPGRLPPPRDDQPFDLTAKRPRLHASYPQPPPAHSAYPEKPNPNRPMNLSAKLPVAAPAALPPPVRPLVPSPRLPSPHHTPQPSPSRQHHSGAGRRSESPRRTPHAQVRQLLYEYIQ